MTKPELFCSDLCYTLFNNNTPHSDQSWTVLFRLMFMRKLVQGVYLALTPHISIRDELSDVIKSDQSARLPRALRMARGTHHSFIMQDRYKVNRTSHEQVVISVWKGGICHLVKWQIHPLIPRKTIVWWWSLSLYIGSVSWLAEEIERDGNYRHSQKSKCVFKH